ncbi:MAG: class I SAM-dependent methyltransferase, partial [Sphaerochaeta sp.]
MDYTEKDFGKILKTNALNMRRLMIKSGTTCMRVYDRNLERFPVTVDLYGPYARITDYSEDGLDNETEAVCCDIVSRMLYVQATHVVFHHRPKRVGKEQHELQSEESLLVEVTENGLTFTVDLTKRIDTGLFLDHMLTREMVGTMSSGLSVLNLFSYTGSFSVYAAKGGAKKVESVDLNATYTAWAQKNLSDNGFSEELFPCIAADAWQYVVEAVKEGRKYDLIVFDPPCFSNSRKMEHDFDVQRDYLRWIKVLNALLTRDGILLFSTNLSSFRMERGKIRGFEVQEISSHVAAPGFTHKKGIARSWLLDKQQEVRIYAEDLQTVDKKAGKSWHDTEKMEIVTMTKKKETNEKMIEDVKKDAVVTEDTVQTEANVEETNEKAVVTEEMTTEEEDASTKTKKADKPVKKAAKKTVKKADKADEVVDETEKAEKKEKKAAKKTAKKAVKADEVVEIVEADEAIEAKTVEIVDEVAEETELVEEEAPVAEANIIEDDVLTLQWEDDDIALVTPETSQDEPKTDSRDTDDRGGRPSYRDRDDRGERPASRG